MKRIFITAIISFCFIPCFAQKADSTSKDTCSIYAPNTITPNNNGTNDVWCITSNCEVKELELWVFDRWGNKIWSTKDIKQCWDATQGEGDKRAPVKEDVYVWKITFINWSGKKQSRVGHVTVIR